MELIAKYRNSSVFKNVLILFTGASVSQVIPFLASPFLARLYSPELFGECGVVLSVAGMFAIVSTLQYETAIMLPRDDEDAFNLLALSLCIAIAVSLLSFVVCSLFAEEIGHALNSFSFKRWVMYVPITVLLSAVFNSFNNWTIRQKNYKSIAFRQVLQSVTQTSVKLGLGILKFVSSGLLLGTIAGQVSSSSVLVYKSLKQGRNLISRVSWAGMKKNALVYKNFPRYTVWQGFLDIANESSLIFLLGSFYGMKMVGFYSFTLALLQKPSQIIGNSIGQVFYQNFSSKLGNSQSIETPTRDLLKNLALIGLLIFVPILLLGGYVFKLFFGDAWYEAGILAQIISPWLFFRFIVSTMSNIAYLKSKQREFFLITTGINISIPLLVLVLSLFRISPFYTFAAVSAAMVLFYIFVLQWIVALTKDK